MKKGIKNCLDYLSTHSLGLKTLKKARMNNLYKQQFPC